MINKMSKMTAQQLMIYGAKLRLAWFRKAEELGTVVAACKYYGIARSEFYYWYSRWLKSNRDIKILYDQSRRPRTNPRSISQTKKDLILKLREKTGGGKGTIKFLLRRDYDVNVSECAINRTLHRADLIKKRRKRKREKRYDPYPYQPGEVGQLDVKHFKRAAYQYSLLDMATRIKFKLVLDQYSPQVSVFFLRQALKFFKSVFSFQTIRTDQGAEFTYSMFAHVTCLHPFEEYLRKLGIRHEINRAAPQRNGRVERSHRTDKYMMRNVPLDDLQLLKQKTKEDCLWYNLKRPHWSLGMRSPVEYLRTIKGFRNKSPDFSVLNV